MIDIDRAVELHTEWCHRESMASPYREPRQPERCPGCGESVEHPKYRDHYADDVRKIGEPLMGWHNECASEMEAERDAVLEMLPSRRVA